MSYLNADAFILLETVAKESPEIVVSAVEALGGSETVLAITRLDEHIKKTFTKKHKDRLITVFKQNLHHKSPYRAVTLASKLDLNTSQIDQLFEVVVNGNKPFAAFQFARDMEITDEQKQRLVDYLVETDHDESFEAAIRFFECLDVTENQERRLREKTNLV